MTASIDVVVPTFNGRDLTRRCLGHLREQTVPHSVIVADNASTDGTAAGVRSEFPEVRIVELEQNLGFPVACNRGAAAGDGDFIVLLNNDVECSPDFLERLVSPFADERVGMVAAVLVRPGTDEIDGVGLTADPTLSGFARLDGRPVREAALLRPVVTGPSGGAAAYRRAAWESAGGLDERIFIYAEDLDLAFRLRAAGWEAAVAADAVAVHLGSVTMGLRSPWQRYQAGFSRGYLLRRYGVLRGSAAARALVTEAAVVVGDAVIARDVSAARGRLAGWRAARGLPRLALPPPAAVDSGIGFRESLRLRRRAYSR
jgi:N-acetylglucosaminyl-diphospho-decaprenol L-rhamnosyltransferase